MSKFFQKYPKIEYKYKLDGIETSMKMTNIQIKYGLSSIIEKTNGAFYNFITRDHDRIDALSNKYYGSSENYWLIMFSNNSFDWYYDFALSGEIFERYMYRKYREDAIEQGHLDIFNDVIAYTKSAIHHYEDSDGDWIDLETYASSSESKSIIYVYDYEYGLNEEKRNINLLSNQLTTQAEKELEKLLKEATN